MRDRRVNILLVEDDPAYERLLRRMLSDAAVDFRLWHVTSAAGAVKALDGRACDVVILDLTLPDSSGLDTVRTVARAARDIPIVVLTGAEDERLPLEAMRCGAQDYLSKSEVNGAVLARCIRYAVERRKAQLAARERRHLQEVVHAMERVLAVVGHELRTPLAALRVTTEFLLTPEAKETAEWDVFLKSIHSEVTRMAELVNNLLEAARLNSGRSSWHWSTIHLNSVCDEAFNVIRPLIAHGRVELRLEIGASPLMMRGDSDAVRRLILNLVSNSAKFTHEGHICLRARALVEEGVNWIEIEVEDTGHGISDSMLGKLGNAFVLSSGALGSDYVKGTGLGLTICKAIVAAHGGHLSVASQPGVGSVFTARLRADLEAPAPLGDDALIRLERAA